MDRERVIQRKARLHPKAVAVGENGLRHLGVVEREGAIHGKT
jgi:hypothetical protein